MGQFGITRLYREDVGTFHRLQFSLFGVGDPGHYLRSLYFKKFTAELNPHFILDAGFGSGDYSFYMSTRWPQARITALDFKNSNVDLMSRINEKIQRANIRILQGDLNQFREETAFDLAVCIDVLEHIPDQLTVLQNLWSSLNPGGYCFLHMPLERYRPVPFDRRLQRFHDWAEEEHIGKMHSRDSLVNLVRDANFEIIRETRTFHYLRGELALSLMAMFYTKSVFSRLAQTAMLPVTRCLCLLDSLGSSRESYALALLLRKPS